ncbi:hypothetical protein I6E52_02775 [Salinibacterium sp. NG253]|uniref:hypothetical protein n=1 Tax=Salinibacterium sp. NG253 TaxID=2792039 RepID=UPI0018CDD4F8|nr:hypothetical protein [Salinibacterium sp. NG253]MBH0115766.1 hypothetical protein [Salinibacterium sp. NG253]
MQLGTRWSVGAAVPDHLSAEMQEAIAGVEADVAHLDTSAWRWTLTWLESRPVAELDDGTIVRQGADGSVSVEEAAS